MDNIEIDLSFLQEFFSQPPQVLVEWLLFNFGWIPIAFVFLWGVLQVWIGYLQGKWGEKNAKTTMLAIDIPKDNSQSPKAVENMFNYLAGAHGSLNFTDVYWEGKYQMSFSFEIVGKDGYTQFLIRTPIVFRDLVESAVYAQYPDAEITEVEDYTEDYKDLRFPHDEYDVWGAEFVQVDPFPYPIKTYKEFEHQMGEPETHFKDPMAALMDLTSSLRKGEQLWYQLILVPTDVSWTKKCDKEVGDILGEKASYKKNIFTKFIDMLIDGIRMIGGALMGGESESSDDSDDALKMMNLKPKQKKTNRSNRKQSFHDWF